MGGLQKLQIKKIPGSYLIKDPGRLLGPGWEFNQPADMVAGGSSGCLADSPGNALNSRHTGKCVNQTIGGKKA